MDSELKVDRTVKINILISNCLTYLNNYRDGFISNKDLHNKIKGQIEDYEFYLKRDNFIDKETWKEIESQAKECQKTWGMGFPVISITLLKKILNKGK